MNTNTLDILKILTPEEFKQFRLVVRSSQYNRNSLCEKLYTILRPKYPEFELSPTDLRKIYKKLFPNKSYNQKNLQKVIDALSKIAESYLLKLHLDKNEILKEKISCLTSAERSGLFDLFKKAQSNVHEILKGKELRDETYWGEKTNLYERLYSNRQHDKYNTSDDTLDKFNKASDLYFAHLKIRYAERLEDMNDSHNIRFVEDIRNAIKDGDFEEENFSKS